MDDSEESRDRGIVRQKGQKVYETTVEVDSIVHCQAPPRAARAQGTTTHSPISPT
jgi:hypothetical protein